SAATDCGSLTLTSPASIDQHCTRLNDSSAGHSIHNAEAAMGITRRRSLALGTVMALTALAAGLRLGAEDQRSAGNQLTPQEKADGWVLLFDGATAGGWMSGDKPLP